MIKLWFLEYPLCFWSQILISHLIDIPKNVIGQKVDMNLGNFNVKWKGKWQKNDKNHNISKELKWIFFVLENFHYILILKFLWIVVFKKIIILTLLWHIFLIHIFQFLYVINTMSSFQKSIMSPFFS
jgi:hypothetical protein